MCCSTVVAHRYFESAVLLVAFVGAVLNHVGMVNGFQRKERSVPLAEWMIVG